MYLIHATDYGTDCPRPLSVFLVFFVRDFVESDSYGYPFPHIQFCFLSFVITRGFVSFCNNYSDNMPWTVM